MSELRDAFERVAAHREEHAPEVNVSPESTPASITEDVGDRGAVYLQRIGEDTDVDAVELLELANELADITTPNLLALFAMRTLSAREYGEACLSAGFIGGFMVGVELERRR